MTSTVGDRMAFFSKKKLKTKKNIKKKRKKNKEMKSGLKEGKKKSTRHCHVSKRHRHVIFICFISFMMSEMMSFVFRFFSFFISFHFFVFVCFFSLLICFFFVALLFDASCDEINVVSYANTERFRLPSGCLLY